MSTGLNIQGRKRGVATGPALENSDYNVHKQSENLGCSDRGDGSVGEAIVEQT